MKHSCVLRSAALLGVVGVAAVMPAGADGKPAVDPGAVSGAEQGPIAGELRDAGRLIRLDSMSTMIVTSTGREIALDPDSTQGTTPQFTSTHTDADFTGGTFIAQGGFAEDEFAGATYQIPNSLFPIRVDSTEMIFAVQGAQQTTTTQWRIQIFDGLPTAGQGAMVANFSSLDDGLPPIVLPGGNAGVNVLFFVDPQDPEQIIILKDPNLGPNDFRNITIAYGIDQHNAQTQNPCFFAPPNCCNAFPCSDVSGLAAPNQNWIKAVQCPTVICPSGGWFRFNQINALCRPSGDWVMRMTWSSLAVPCNGDANEDGQVDVDDLNEILAHWFTPQPTGSNGDVTSNGFVNVDDLNLVLGNWGQSC